jgi:hypothetical protein
LKNIPFAAFTFCAAAATCSTLALRSWISGDLLQAASAAAPGDKHD